MSRVSLSVAPEKNPLIGLVRLEVDSDPVRFGVQAVLVALGAAFFPDNVAAWFDWRRRLIGYLIAMPFLFAFDFASAGLFAVTNLIFSSLPNTK